MGLIDSGSKSSRLLASRRYTHNTFTTAQESFTNVLDLRAEEIYTRAHLIPSSSLPFSGSSQLGLTHSVKGQPVVKYWFRQQLTKSNTNNEVWFFTNPTGSGEGIGAQLIDDNQQTNFVSPKYSLSSLASATTEDSTPGYLAVLYKSTAVASSEETSSLGSGDIVSTNDYIFDYKTGVVQFLNSDKDPSDSEYVYMTAYQYVGDTLKSGIEIEGQVSASNLLVTDTLKAGTLISPEITLATASIEAITASVAEMKEFTNADTISGSFTALSGSVATRFDSRETDMTLATASIEAITSSISRLDSETETNDANITLATASIAAITASVSRIDSEIDTNAANITLATASIAAITASLGQPVNTDSDVTFGDITSTGTITAVEVHTTFVSSSIAVISGSNNFGDEVGDLHSFTGSIAVSSSLSVTGSTTIDGTLTVDEIGAFTAGGAIDFNDQNMTNVDIDSGDITGITFGTTTSAIITGSTTAVSSSIATRFDSRETDMTLATASIAAITASVAEMKEFTKATTISGSFTSVSSSIATRFDSREVDMTLATASIAAITSSISRIDSEIDTNAANITLATASIAALTASISRLNDEISTDDTDMNLATASIAAITASISELRTHETLSTASIEAITSSIAEMKEFTKATTISGSFTSVSSSIATRFDSREVDMTLATASIAAITSSIDEMKAFTSATVISGSTTALSSSIATRFDSRETDMTLATASIALNESNMTLATASIAALTASISRLNDEISTDDTDMNLATASIAAITASISRIDSEIDTNAANITLATASIAAITASLGQPVNTDSDVTFGDITSTGTITAVEVHTTFVSSSIAVISGSNNFGDDTSDHHSFTGSLSVSSSLSVTGSTTIDGTLTVDEIGAFTAGGAIDFGDQNMTNVDIDSGDITGVTFGTATSTTISGSTTAVSSSIATRFDSRETDMTLATASIAAITASVSRIDSEIDTNTTNITLATASIAAITSSISELKTSATLSTASIAAITASISRINDSLDETSGIFEQTGSFFRTHNDLQITGSLSVSGLLTGSFSGLEVGQKYKHVQTTPSSTWTVSHGFDYQYVNIDVYNGSDELVIPASVVATDSNTITISFNTPLSGVAIVSTGGQAVDELGKNVIFEQSTVSTNWRVTHSIGEQYPAVTVYDENDNVIIPERINAVDASKMDIIFTNAVSGNANISVGGGQLRNAITGSEQLSFDSFGDISGSVSSTGSFGRLEVVGNGNIDGNLTLGGNITIGDADSDSITINADLTSNLIPNADSTFDLGSTSKFWRNAYIDSITTTGNISGSVSSTGSFGNVNVSEMSITSVSIMSSSVATRFDSRETDMTLATASIAAITSSVSEMKEFTVASTISGSFTAVSSSIASRLDSLSGDVIALSIALG